VPKTRAFCHIRCTQDKNLGDAPQIEIGGKASFQRPEDVRPGESAKRICVDADQCEIIAGRRYDGSDACDLDEQLMKVHKCDGHGKVDCALVKSMFRRETFSF
jgi:hypothetical protein